MILSPAVKHLLRYLALAYVTVLVIVPVGLILWRTFAPGVGAFVDSITTPAAISALHLSLLVVAIVVPPAFRWRVQRTGPALRLSKSARAQTAVGRVLLCRPAGHVNGRLERRLRSLRAAA